MPNLEKEAKKYGTYKNTLFNKIYDKIQVITIDAIMEGARLEIPMIDVLKSAERKYKGKQLTIEE
jgi:hypothetical protein